MRTAPGCVRREKPPTTETSGRGGKEPPMGPKEPDWVEVPDDWTDKKRSDNPEIARIQEFLGNNVKEEVIRRHLLAEGIGKPGELEINNVSVNVYNEGRNCEITVNFNVRGMAWKERDKGSTSGQFY